MFQNTYFTFNNISSELMDVIACYINTKERQRQYALNRSLISEKNINNPLPYDFGYDTEVLKGELTIAPIDCSAKKSKKKLDTKKLTQIAEWLYQDSYKPLISNDNPDIVYYVKFTDEHQVYLFNDEGYITLSFICNAPWAWTKLYAHEFDLRNHDFTAAPFEFEIENAGNYDNYNGLEAEIELYKSGSNILPDDISIRNTRNTLPQNSFRLTNSVNSRNVARYRFLDGENIYIHMGKRLVESDNAYVSSRLYNCNKQWIRLEKGKNTIEIYGRCRIKIYCQYPVLI